MNAVWKLYAKMLGLLVVLTGIVTFNVLVWGLHRQPTPPSLYVPGGDPEHGRQLIANYGCGACHIVPGVVSATGIVGPRLDQMRHQIYVAGTLPNTPPSLTRWIMDPRAIHPQTAMPDLDVSENDARDIAAYLYALR